MNFHTNVQSIRNTLQDGWRKKTGKNGGNTSTYSAGCYLISRVKNDSFLKLGMAGGLGGLYNRLKNYTICMPLKGTEYFVHYLILCPKITHNGKSFSSILEKKLLDGIDSRTKQSYSTEWLIDKDTKKLDYDIKRILNENRHLWMYALKGTDRGFKIVSMMNKIDFNKAPVTRKTDLLFGEITKDTRAKTYSFNDKEMKEYKKNITNKTPDESFPALKNKKKPIKAIYFKKRDSGLDNVFNALNI